MQRTSRGVSQIVEGQTGVCMARHIWGLGNCVMLGDGTTAGGGWEREC